MKKPRGASPPPPSQPPSSGIDHYLNHVWGKSSAELAEAATRRPEDEVAAAASATPAVSSAGSAPPPPPPPPPTTTTATRALPEHERPFAGFKNKAFKNRTEAWNLFKEKVLEPIVKPEITPGEWAKRFAKGAIFNNTREMAEWVLESEDAERLPVENKFDLANNISWSLKERTKACNASFGAPPDGCAESTKREAKALTDRLDDLAMWSYTDIVRKSNSSTNSSTEPKEPEVSHQRSGLS